MNTAQLKEYLGDVVALEKLIFYQGWQILQWQGERGALRRKMWKQAPSAPPKAPQNPLPGMLKKLLGSFILIVAAAAVLSACVFGPTKWSLVGLFGGILLGLIVVVAIYSFRMQDTIEKWSDPSTRREIFDRYEAEKLAHQEKAQAYAVKDVLATARMEVLSEAIDQEKAKQAENKRALADLYAQDVIYPKYRRLLPVCSLWEYLQSGRCQKLEGPDGAYQLLETELQEKKIAADLLDFNPKTARAMQFGAYMVFDELQEQIAIMTAEIDRRVEAKCAGQGPDTPTK